MPSTMGAIWLQHHVVPRKQCIKLATDLFNQHFLCVWTRSPMKLYHHHHLTRNPIIELVRFAHQLCGITRHARIPPCPLCDLEVCEALSAYMEQHWPK